MKTIFAGVVAVAAGVTAFATDYNWTLNSGTGVFQTGANWNPQIAGGPGATDTAFFNLAGTYGVAFQADAENAGVTVGSGVDVSYGLGGYAWRLGTVTLGSPSTARFANGLLRVQNSLTVGTSRKLVLDSGTSEFMGATSLATASGGMIEVNGGDHKLAWEMTLAPAPSGGQSFRMTGGTLALTNRADKSRWNVNDGAKAALEGGTFSANYIIDVFNAVVDVHSNATLNFTGLNGFNIGRKRGAQGVVNVLGGTLLSSSAVSLGYPAGSVTPNATTGVLNLVDGSVSATTISFGGISNSVGILEQTGGELRVTANFLVGNVNSSLGIYRQGGGKAWCNTVRVGNAPFGTGEIWQTGGTLATPTACYVGCVSQTVGRVTQSGGEFIVSNTVVLGNGVNTCGIYTNTGGSMRMTGRLSLGYGAGAYGRLHFSGDRLDAPSGIIVGAVAGGTGELALAGGQVTITNAGANLIVGDVIGSSGSLTISGGTNLLCRFRAGSSGNGLARITGGYTYSGTNTFSSEAGRVVVAEYGTSTSRLELAGGVLAVGQLGGRSPALPTPGGYSELLLDGGTLLDTGEEPSAAFLADFGKAELTDRGAVIVSDGVLTTVAQPLLNAAGHAGSFTKKGAGPLRLASANNAFTGRVTVEQGELLTYSAGAIYLTGGVVVEPGALLNLTAGTVRDALTASGTVSRIDGALALKSGLALTNGLGAALGGSGVVTGGVVFAAGSAVGRDKADAAGPLLVTGGAVFESGATVRLTGYTEQELAAGIQLVQAGEGATLQAPVRLPATLDGASDSTWFAKVTPDGRTLVTRRILAGTLLRVK